MNLFLVPASYVKSPFRPLIKGMQRTQLQIVYNLMKDGKWRTLREISVKTKQPIQSVSARLRDLRKKQYGRLGVVRALSDKPRVYLYKVEV